MGDISDVRDSGSRGFMLASALDFLSITGLSSDLALRARC